MIIYNVTIILEKKIESEWLQWIKPHIKEVLATGCFSDARFTKVLTAPNDQGPTYSIQYRALTKANLERYYSEHAERLRTVGVQKFGDKMLAFRTEMALVEEF
ncbi:MAG: DUF4286 family protein [Flavobacteriaceae bacterium]|nr:DUF4286 family protein [Flavobacteriaceae bacterium]